MPGSIRLPFYEYQTNPQGGYGGPSFGDILGAANRKTQRGEVLRGAVMEVGQRFLEQQRKIQDMYSQSQLGLAKATYYAKVKQEVEQLEFSKLGPMDYPDRFREISNEAYAAAREILNQSQGKTLVGYTPVTEQTLYTNFEAWRTEQDAGFQSYVLQSQRKKMTAAAMQVKQDQLKTIRMAPEYLDEFIASTTEERDRGLIPPEFAQTIIARAQKLAAVAGYDQVARGIAANNRELVNKVFGAPAPPAKGARGEIQVPSAPARGGLAAAEAYVADRNHFPLLVEDAEYEQFKQDFGFYTGNIRLQAETAKDAQVGKAAEDYLTRYANNQLTRDYILKDARTSWDENAPRGSDEADDLRRRYLGLLEAKYARGGEDAPSSPLVKRLAWNYIYDEAVERTDAETFLKRGLDAYLSGQPGLNFADFRQGMDEVQQRKPYTGFLAAVKDLETAASSGLISHQRAADASERLRQWILLRRKQHEADPSLPSMKPEEISQETQNILDDAVHMKESEGININKKPTRQQQAEQRLYTEVQKLDKKVNGPRMKALTTMIRNGSLKGLANQPEWTELLDKAQPFYEKQFQQWGALRPGQYEVSRVNYSGLTVFTYSETRPPGQGGGSVTVFFTPIYDRQLDRWTWAAYQPSSGQVLPLIDPVSKQPMAFYQALDEAWRHAIRTITK